MTTFLLLFLVVFTIAFAFVVGIALGYWAIFGILDFFDPARVADKASQAQALAPTPSGD